MRRHGLLWVAIACTIIAGRCSKEESTKPLSGQPAGSTAAVGTAGTAASVKSDVDYVHDVAVMNMADIELSRMALGKATGADVKLFAQRVIDEGNTASDKLKELASGHQIDWPAQLDDDHTQAANELAKKQGADFDHEYVKAVVHGRQDLAARLESRLDLQSLTDWKTAAAGRTQSQVLPDPNAALRDVQVRPDKSDNETTKRVNQWAAETYPVVQKQLDTARTLEKATKNLSTK